MKKKVFILVLAGCILLLGLTGCGKAETLTVPLTLEEVNQKIQDYFSEEGADLSNWTYHYIDEENQVVVVGLLDNSSEEQEDFLEKVFTAKERDEIRKENLIDFVKGEPLTNDSQS
ncbi:MAG TPA: hypothetical protein IAC24_01230 [Candidatus Onthousia faecigallinarum]|nr:hypothetical protein [Candidatus Onthousia faecigallinarum]